MTSRKKFIKTIKSVSDHYFVHFLGKGRVFEFESLFSMSTLLYTSRLSLSFQLAFEGVSLIFRCDDPTYNNPSYYKWGLRKIYFDMLKSTGFGDLVRHFSSSRQSNRVYLGWFVWYLVGRLFKLQALRQSRKARASVLLALLLALGCMCTSNCGDPYVSPGCTIFFFSSGVFLPYFSMFMFISLFLVTACLRAGFQVFLS